MCGFLNERLEWHYWGIIGGIFGLLVFLIAVILHSITEPISFFTHWVSHLGWGPNGAEYVFKVGLIVLGCLVTPYILNLTRFLWAKEGQEHQKIINLINFSALICSIIALIGLVLTSLYGNIKQADYSIHLMGAVTYFMMAMIFMLLYTISLVLNGNKGKAQLIITVVNLSFFIGLIIAAIPIMQVYSGFGFIMEFRDLTPDERIQLLKDNIPRTMWLTFFEWLYVLATCVWFVITGLYTKKLSK